MRSIALLTLCLPLASAPAGAAPQFQPPRAYATGVAAARLALGDLNGDARPDLVVADSQTGIAVLMNQGDGRFGAAAVYSVGPLANAIRGLALCDLDGDGQMDPRLIGAFVRPIALGQADYTKGNRFFRIEDVRTMPGARLLGNAVLSFLSKLSTGYWNLFDPTNGYTALHLSLLDLLALDKVADRYFFETDLLFRLSIVRAVARDVPMAETYRGVLPFLASDAVRVTLGPKSKSVLIQKKWGTPIVCNDGVTIAKEFEIKDPEENLGAQVLRQAAEKTSDVVGDGTSISPAPRSRSAPPASKIVRESIRDET